MLLIILEEAIAKVSLIEIQKHLKGMDYPVSKQDLLEHAQKGGADQAICSVLEQLPDEEYETPAEVSQAIGQIKS